MHVSPSLLTEVKINRVKLIMANTEGEPEYVIMSYRDYLALHGKGEISWGRELTSDELLDKINHEIAQWKEGQTPMVDLGDSSVTRDEDENVLYFEAVE